MSMELGGLQYLYQTMFKGKVTTGSQRSSQPYSKYCTYSE
jgi:hypothetical protein